MTFRIVPFGDDRVLVEVDGRDAALLSVFEDDETGEVSISLGDWNDEGEWLLRNPITVPQGDTNQKESA